MMGNHNTVVIGDNGGVSQDPDLRREDLSTPRATVCQRPVEGKILGDIPPSHQFVSLKKLRKK